MDGMKTTLEPGAQGRLAEYVNLLGAILGDPGRRASFAIYAMGLLGKGERKSAEPIAALACPDPMKVDAAHQRLLHFVGKGRWSDVEVRHAAARYALAEVVQRAPIDSWIIDDTGHPRFGAGGRHANGRGQPRPAGAGR